VNRYYSLFREAIREHQNGLRDQFTGTVEVGESWFGATRPRGQIGPKKRGRGTGKQALFGIVERGGHVFTELFLDAKKKTLQSLTRGKVALDATVISDRWRPFIHNGIPGHRRNL